MKFLYGQKVKVIDGFYKGQQGIVIECESPYISYVVEIVIEGKSSFITITPTIEEAYLEANQ